VRCEDEPILFVRGLFGRMGLIAFDEDVDSNLIVAQGGV
jgi:hypothetical protein